MRNKIEIYQTANKETEISVQFEEETVWLNRHQLSELFDRDIKTIGKHLGNVFKEGELSKEVVVAKFATTTQHGAIKGKTQIKQVEYYNLDVIISVGYRVKSKRGTQFRQWATQRLKDYLVQGYAINQQRLQQKQQEVEYLKSGIRILNRALEQEIDDTNHQMLSVFAKGLELLDDYDHQTLDTKGNSIIEVVYPSVNEYLSMVTEMYSAFASDVFAKPKDQSFDSSVNQIRQAFDRQDLYPSLEEKAANLLYLIVKNHSFVDGNKRIAAACFLYFLQTNNMLIINGKPIISNEALAALTLFIATSRTEEVDIVKRLVISVLNRNR